MWDKNSKKYIYFIITANHNVKLELCAVTVLKDSNY